jgi:hypothetical protein
VPRAPGSKLESPWLLPLEYTTMGISISVSPPSNFHCSLLPRCTPLRALLERLSSVRSSVSLTVRTWLASARSKRKADRVML